MISVVIPAFYVERAANLPMIYDALMMSVHPPVEVLVWNNGPAEAVEYLVKIHPEVKLIQAHRNVGCKARFLAAMCTKGDHVLFHDDDIMVKSRTLENMMLHMADFTVLSLNGRRLHKGVPYSASSIIDGVGASHTQEIDISNGRLELVPRKVINNVLSIIPFEESTVMDDIWFSWALDKHGYQKIVVPYSLQSGYTNLDTRGVGSSEGANAAWHYSTRNKLVDELFFSAN